MRYEKAMAWLDHYELRPVSGMIPQTWDGSQRDDSVTRLWMRDHPPRRDLHQHRPGPGHHGARHRSPPGRGGRLRRRAATGGWRLVMVSRLIPVLPHALVNYLARLGWSHGDDELFTREQMVSWFDGSHLSNSAAQFNIEKLNWLNNHYIKQADNARLAELAKPRMLAAGAQFDGAPELPAVLALMKERTNTVNELAEQHPSLKVKVDGHTDWIGTDGYNMGLGERRAAAVKQYLMRKGVAGDRIDTTSYGESKPVASNQTDEGRAQNRRTELRTTAEP